MARKRQTARQKKAQKDAEGEETGDVALAEGEEEEGIADDPVAEGEGEEEEGIADDPVAEGEEEEGIADDAPEEEEGIADSKEKEEETPVVEDKEMPMETQEPAQEAPAEEPKTKEQAEEEPAKTEGGKVDAAEESETAKTEATEDKEEKKDDEEETKKDTPKKERKKKKERTRPYELEKYWKAVKTNPADFTGWTYLLQFVEQEDYMPFYREAFNAFFEHYPYCYGYWKKYADSERKKGNLDKCWAVFDKGLKAIPLSSDLWLHYISVTGQNIPRSDPERADKLRGLYERAVAAAGMDFRSDKLWDQYITFEKKEQKDWKRVMQLYDRILKIPTQLYRHHFDKLKEFVNSHLPKDYLDFDEFLTFREQVVAEASLKDDGEMEDDGGIPGEDAPPGEEGPPGEDAPPGLGAPSSKVIEGENKLIQEKVIESRRAIFRETEKEVSKRWAYEEAIRRPYFHAKPLEKGQLKTWREYLQFEETNGDHDRIVLLYERCLIACALYEEFWLKYARYMEKKSKADASAVFKRGCGTHLPNKPAINIQWAAFEEQNGDIEVARDILEKLQSRQQDSVMIRLERINFERRKGNMDQVIKLYEGCIDDAKTATGQSFFAGKLARFYQKILQDTDNAMKVLEKVLEQKQVSPVLREQMYTLMLDVEYQRTPMSEDKMVKIFDMALASPLSQTVKVQFAQKKIQFLQDFATNPTATHDAVEEHQRLVKNQTSGKKRGADDGGDASSATSSAPAATSGSKATDKKKAKVESSPGNNQGYNNNGGGNAGGSGGYNYGYNHTQQQQQPPQGQAQPAGGFTDQNYPTSWSSWGSYFQS